MQRNFTNRTGGATLEYILVSTFAAVVSLTALGFVGKVVESQLGKMADELGLDPPEGLSWNDSSGGGG